MCYTKKLNWGQNLQGNWGTITNRRSQNFIAAGKTKTLDVPNPEECMLNLSYGLWPPEMEIVPAL